MKTIIKGIMSIFLILALSFAIYIAYYNYNHNLNSTKIDEQINYKEIIQRELKETGKLVVLEGTTQYVATQEDIKKLPGTSIKIGNRTLALDLKFKYGYSIDLSTIGIDVSKDITLIVDSKSIVLDYVYLDVNNSVVESSASLLVKSYTPEEISEIQKACTENMRNGLLNNQENILKARSSLEKQLNLLVNKIAGRQAVIRYK